MMKFNVDGTLGSPFTAGGSIRGFSVSINQLDLLQKEFKFVSLIYLFICVNNLPKSKKILNFKLFTELQSVFLLKQLK